MIFHSSVRMSEPRTSYSRAILPKGRKLRIDELFVTRHSTEYTYDTMKMLYGVKAMKSEHLQSLYDVWLAKAKSFVKSKKMEHFNLEMYGWPPGSDVVQTEPAASVNETVAPIPAMSTGSEPRKRRHFADDSNVAKVAPMPKESKGKNLAKLIARTIERESKIMQTKLEVYKRNFKKFRLTKSKLKNGSFSDKDLEMHKKCKKDLNRFKKQYDIVLTRKILGHVSSDARTKMLEKMKL